MVAKYGTNTSDVTFEMIAIIESMAMLWVRCASSNVFVIFNWKSRASTVSSVACTELFILPLFVSLSSCEMSDNYALVCIQSRPRRLNYKV